MSGFMRGQWALTLFSLFFFPFHFNNNMKFSTVVLAALAAAVTAECTNSTNAGCSTCGSASYVTISTWCSKYSGWSQSCCKCIVQAESGGNLHACNKNSNGSIDVGLWQINSGNWASCNGGNPPCDTSSNLFCAKKLFQGGGNTWKHWPSCSSCGCCSKA